ncbi:MAG: GNAT family N-acetyltransferase, partial [Limnoraphis sp.]
MPNIKQIKSVDAINAALDSGFYQTIDDCFSVPPFSEIITREKVNYYFHKYVNQGVLYLAYENSKPIGFVATLPLIKTKNIGELSFIDTWVYYQGEKICLTPEFFTQKTQLTLDEHQYIASLGVDPKFRRRGIARKLFQTLFSHFDSSVAYVLRTTNNPNYAYIPKFY